MLIVLLTFVLLLAVATSLAVPLARPTKETLELLVVTFNNGAFSVTFQSN